MAFFMPVPYAAEDVVRFDLGDHSALRRRLPSQESRPERPGALTSEIRPVSLRSGRVLPRGGGGGCSRTAPSAPLACLTSVAMIRFVASVSNGVSNEVEFQVPGA